MVVLGAPLKQTSTKPAPASFERHFTSRSMAALSNIRDNAGQTEVPTTTAGTGLTIFRRAFLNCSKVSSKAVEGAWSFT